MPRKSYAQLQKELLNLQQRALTLATDSFTGVMTRAALDLDFIDIEKRARFILILYVPNPGPHAPGALRRVMHTAHAGTFYRARWDDKTYLFFGDKDAESLFDRVNSSMRAEYVQGYCFGKSTKPGDLLRDVLLLVTDAQEAHERIAV